MQVGYPAVVLSVQVADESGRNCGNTLLSITQRRKRDVENVQPIIQVFAKVIVPDRPFR